MHCAGAQIISCKVGDSRLKGMETNVGLTRSLISVLHHKADLINLSYGESTATPNAGRFIELANEVDITPLKSGTYLNVTKTSIASSISTLNIMKSYHFYNLVRSLDLAMAA